MHVVGVDDDVVRVVSATIGMACDRWRTRRRRTGAGWRGDTGGATRGRDRASGRRRGQVVGVCGAKYRSGTPRGSETTEDRDKNSLFHETLGDRRRLADSGRHGIEAGPRERMAPRSTIQREPDPRARGHALRRRPSHMRSTTGEKTGTPGKRTDEQLVPANERDPTRIDQRWGVMGGYRRARSFVARRESRRPEVRNSAA